MPAHDALASLIHQELHALSHPHDPDVARLTGAIAARHGGAVDAVLLYGSYLRGKRDTLLDFYVLLDDLGTTLPRRHATGNRLLPPNVYYLALPAEGDRPAVRAKYATVSTAQFAAAMDDFHSYFWSRFTQPAGLVAVRDTAVEGRVVDAICHAVDTFIHSTVPLLDAPFTSDVLWQRGFALTYASELRSESRDGVGSLYRQDPERFDRMLDAYTYQPGAAIAPATSGAYRPAMGLAGRGRARAGWALRRALGKVLSVLRLVKAAGTFDDPLDYLLWKIERHSGIYIQPTERARRHPLIFAWPLLWRLYRRGAFR